MGPVVSAHLLSGAGEVADGSQHDGAPPNTSFHRLNSIVFQSRGQKLLGIMLFIMKSVSHFRDSVFSFAITFAKL